MISSLPALLTSKNEGILVFEEDKSVGCGNLSSTLQKLYNWEKKLLEELMVSVNFKCISEPSLPQAPELLYNT